MKIELKTLIVIALLAIVVIVGIMLLVTNKDFGLMRTKKTDDKGNEIAEEVEEKNDKKEKFISFELVLEEGYKAETNSIAHYHIIGKKENGTWQEIIAVDGVNGASLFVEIIGLYDNKLYYTDNNGFAYIDLLRDNFERISWIDYNEEKTDYDILRYFLIKNGKLYFCKAIKNNNSNINASHISSIYSLNFNDTSLDNAQLIVEDATLCKESTADNTIYYEKHLDLYSYDILTKESKFLFNYYPYYSFGSSKILYGKDAYGGDLFIYNLNTDENTKLDDGFSCYSMKNDDVYYAKDDNVIKVSNTGKNIIYENSIDGYTLNYISFFEDVLELDFRKNDPVDGGSITKYIVNGKVQDDKPVISVLMKDGNIKEFSIDLID